MRSRKWSNLESWGKKVDWAWVRTGRKATRSRAIANSGRRPNVNLKIILRLTRVLINCVIKAVNNDICP